MNPACSIVLVTAPNLKTARNLARAALDARLAACVNIVPGVESHYWWLNRVESAREILLVLKTTQRRLPALRRLILARHPYDTPEFIALKIDQGAPRYLDWILQSVQAPARTPSSPAR